jgi:uncharacterized protein YhaN
MLKRYRDLLAAFEISTDFGNMEPEEVIGNIRTAVQKLKIEFEKQKTYKDLLHQEKNTVEQLEMATTRLRETRTALERFLDSVNAPDPATCRQWIEDAVKRRELEQTISEKEAVLMTMQGIQDRTQIRSLFKSIDWDARKAELDHLQGTLNELDQEIMRINEKIGADEQKKNDFEKKADLAVLRQEEAASVAKLESAFQEWMEWEIAGQLVDRARERFEKERQPEILKQASAYFSILTNGAWNGIRIRLGEKLMEAVRSNGDSVPILNLSSGTAEPFYLALRLALISDFAGSPLGAPPVLMDDILVNFDDSRARNAANALVAAGKDTQIILLTCHSRTLEEFNKHDQVRIVKLGANG